MEIILAVTNVLANLSAYVVSLRAASSDLLSGLPLAQSRSRHRSSA